MDYYLNQQAIGVYSALAMQIGQDLLMIENPQQATAFT